MFRVADIKKCGCDSVYFSESFCGGNDFKRLLKWRRGQFGTKSLVINGVRCFLDAHRKRN